MPVRPAPFPQHRRGPGSATSALPPGAGAFGLGTDALWAWAGLASTVAANLGVAALALRRLGAPSYGVFALVSSVLGLVAVADFGLSLSVARSEARRQAGSEEPGVARRQVEAAHRLCLRLALLTLAAAGLATLGAALAPARLAHHGQLTPTTALVGVAASLSLGTSALAGLARGQRRFGAIAGAGWASAAANLACVATLSGRAGLVSLGWGQLAGVLTGRAVLAAWARRQAPWFRLLPRRLPRPSLGQAAATSLPLLALSLAGQLITASDLVVVTALSSAAAAALYRLGSLVPSQASILLYTALDTSFPVVAGLAEARAQEELARLLTRVSSFVAGAGFAALVLLRSEVVAAVLGRPAPLASSVLGVFCLVWLANVPVHCLMLVLIGRGEHRLFLPVVAAEAALNVVLTVALVAAMGPLGAALATLATLAFSNLVAIPVRARRLVGLDACRMVWASGVVPALLGAGAGAAGAAPSLALGGGSARLALGLALGAAAALAAGWWLLGRQGRLGLRRLLSSKPGPLLAPVLAGELP
jgi:O-antigen/teichoic acid export membrane protein